MSGDYQHFIPQLLLKGFSTKAPDGAKSVWVFRKNMPPSLEPIKRFGGETHFYSLPGEETLDGKITKYENRLTKLVRVLRKQKPGPVADAATPAEVISHLAIRTEGVRTGFSRAAKQMILKAAGVFTNEENLRNLLGLEGGAPSAAFQQMIAKWVEENPTFRQTGLPASALERIVFGLAKENFSRLFEEQRPQVHAALAGIYTQAENFIRDGHNKALTRTVVPEGRVETLRKMQWTVIEVQDNVILPDCVAISIDGDGNATPLLLSNSDNPAVVVMPVGARRLAVGKVDPASAFQTILFNLHAAACSESFFVSAANTAELAEWSKYVGVRSQTVINEGLADVFAEYNASKTATPNSADAEAVSAPVEHDAASPPCAIYFCNGIDEPTGNAIAGTVWGVIEALRGLMPLNRLDGVTFADDYVGALGNVDYGYAVQMPRTTTTEEGALGVAMAPLVMRDGVVKSHIVMRGFLGPALIREDDEYHKYALHVLIQELAVAASAELIDTALPGFLLRPFGSEFDAIRYKRIESAWTSYYAASISAPFAPENGEFLRLRAVAALDRARDDIPELRLDYRFHGDVPKLLGGSLSRIGSVLENVAALIGHFDGIGQSPFDDTGGLEAALNKLGLRQWFDSYQNDFRKLWERRGRWESIDELFALNTHVERLMWQFGMVLWQMPDGSCRVEVPRATDLKRLPRETVKRPLWLAKTLARNLWARMQIKRRTG